MLSLTFSRQLSTTEQSQTLSELSDNFMSNPVQLMGRSMTVMETPVLLSENGRSKKSESLHL